MKNKKVLITGVAGLLGSRLAEWVLHNTDYGVVGIDDLSGGYKENIPDNVDFYQMDLVTHPIENVFEYNDIDYVFHFDAYAAEGLSSIIKTIWLLLQRLSIIVSTMI